MNRRFTDSFMGRSDIPSSTSTSENIGVVLQSDFRTDITIPGYRSLDKSPEIKTAVSKIADLVSGMTIHLMENRENGDVRIRNELSRKIDITPYKNMTRKNWIYNIVYSMLLPGDGNAVIYPKMENGLISELKPLNPNKLRFETIGDDYVVVVDSTIYESDEILHFAINPDPEEPWKGTGYRSSILDVANNLKQASHTRKEFMSGQYMPNVIIKVDALSEDMASETGRQQIKDKYLGESKPGEPWVIPAELLDVETIRPLSLKDIAINESVEIDKKTVASLLDVPSFILGVGDFNKDEYNNFIRTRIKAIADVIQQTLTRGLILNPNWYFKCNPKSLMAYDTKELAEIGMNLYIRGIYTGNDVLNSIGDSPKEGLDELIILENFIPQSMIGDQNKLKGGDDN